MTRLRQSMLKGSAAGKILGFVIALLLTLYVTALVWRDQAIDLQDQGSLTPAKPEVDAANELARTKALTALMQDRGSLTLTKPEVKAALEFARAAAADFQKAISPATAKGEAYKRQ